MFGDIINTLILVLRKSQVVTENKMSVCVEGSDEESTVNTPLPAIAIGVEDSQDADVFIGGAVKDKLKLKLSVIVNLSNYSWTNDNFRQAKLISLAQGVRNAIELARKKGEFAELETKYDFFALYKGFETGVRSATRNEIKVEVSITILKYDITVLDKGLLSAMNPTQTVSEVDLTGFSGTAQDKTTIINDTGTDN